MLELTHWACPTDGRLNGMTLRLGLYRPTQIPLSVERYVDSTCQQLEALGVAISAFSQGEPPPPGMDVYWDPGTGRPAPCKGFLEIDGPLVVTYHGAANVSLAIGECFDPGLVNRLIGSWSRADTLRSWRSFKGRMMSVIAVSDHAADEFRTHIPVQPGNVATIYHGVDHDLFSPEDRSAVGGTPYFLHVSSYQPKKNLDRILTAHARLDPAVVPRLLAVVPGYRPRDSAANIELVDEALDHRALATLYRNATAFVFPSLHETFGMPILEAMASGCPVITSHDSACAETAGDAALLVDPRNVEEIAAAMTHVVRDSDMRDELRRKGLRRARTFTWRNCAKEHLAVFEAALVQGKAA